MITARSFTTGRGRRRYLYNIIIVRINYIIIILRGSCGGRVFQSVFGTARTDSVVCCIWTRGGNPATAESAGEEPAREVITPRYVPIHRYTHGLLLGITIIIIYIYVYACRYIVSRRRRCRKDVAVPRCVFCFTFIYIIYTTTREYYYVRVDVIYNLYFSYLYIYRVIHFTCSPRFKPLIVH